MMTVRALPPIELTLPKVTLVSSPNFRGEEFPYEFDSLNVPEVSAGGKLVEAAGRVCYMSFGTDQGRRSNEAYTRNLMAHGHGSVLEHANYSLLIEGVSRSLTHELVRHRSGFSFSQLSQRFVDESDVCFVLPPELEAAHEGVQAVFRLQCAVAKAGYAALILSLEPQVLQSLASDPATQDLSEAEQRREARKRVRQTARAVLPNATETKILVTANARAWRHFINVRGARGADVEIRRLTALIAQTLKEFAAPLFDDVQVDEAFAIAPVTTVEYPKP